MKRQDHQKKQQAHASLLFLSLQAGAIGYGGWLVYSQPHLFGLPLVGRDAVLLLLAVMLTAATVKVTAECWRRLINLGMFIRGVRGDQSRGSVEWLSVKEAEQADLHVRKPGAVFCGILQRIPLWLWTETHHLIIGPAGSAKSTSAIFNIVASIRCSCLISDIKGEIFEVMAGFQRRLGYTIVKLDPTDPKSAQINVCNLVAKYLHEGSPKALTLARGIALQLYPEPKQGGSNKFFRDGARRLISGLILCAAAVDAPDKATMTRVYLALTDQLALLELLTKASTTNMLDGAVAAIADDLHSIIFGDDNEHYEDFRTGAMNVLEAFGPGDYLQRISSKTTFSFDELKKRRIACYLIIDFNNIKVLGPWSGLMQYIAAFQLVEARNDTPVKFILDEFCNAPLHTLPEILTLLRSYGVSVVMATQDIADIIRVYGKEAFETIMSETDIKQFLSGVRNKSTLEFLSKMLGERTEVGSNFAFGPNGPSESVSGHARPLMTPDEIRRLSDTAQIIFFANLKPMMARKVQIFSIAPWRKKIGINRMYSNKRFLKPVELRIRGDKAWVTRRGREQVKKSRSFWRIVKYMLMGLIPPAIVPTLGVAALSVWMMGFPYMLWEYRGYPNQRTYSWCHYIGPKPFVTRGSPCPMFLLKRDW